MEVLVIIKSQSHCVTIKSKNSYCTEVISLQLTRQNNVIGTHSLVIIQNI